MDILTLKLLRYQKLYEQTQDPVYVWACIDHLKNYNVDHPHWVTDYLEDLAFELFSLDRTGKDYPQKVVDAIGVEQSSLSERNRQDRDINIYLYIERLPPGHTKTKAFELAADKFGMALPTVKAIYYRTRKYADPA